MRMNFKNLKHNLKKSNRAFRRILGVAILGCSSSIVSAQCSQVVWEDNFDGSSLDLNKWVYQVGNGTEYGYTTGWGNGERQFYTSRTENVSVSNGTLKLIARSENYGGAAFTSGRIATKGKASWNYGSFEARIKMPTPYLDCKIWPAFWMLPDNNNWPTTGEIDIAESGLQYNEGAYNGTIHYNYNGDQFIGTGVKWLGDLDKDFHKYRVDWTPTSIKWYVDDILQGEADASKTIGGTWPFNTSNKFYFILNLAVGGKYPGFDNPNTARYPLTMEVDYVRVMSTPSAVSISGDTKVLQGEKGRVYSVPSVQGNTYSWSVPSGATIVKGQNTNAITVDYGQSAQSGNVSVVISTTGQGCVGTTVNQPISVVPNTCTMVMEDGESAATRNLGYEIATGWLNRANTASTSNPTGTFANPSKSGINTSNNVIKYERNAGVQYDVLTYNDFVIGNPEGYKSGAIHFEMDVYSSVPSGTEILLQFENKVRQQYGWPNGVHSRYTAKTGTPNTWNKLTFTFLDAPDAYQNPDSIDKITLLLAPNTYTNGIYYFDNFKSVGNTPATSSINGQSTVCASAKGVTYSVTGFVGSTYNWTVPANATIKSGQGTNSITVDFATTGGNVTVLETSSVNCVGTTKTFATTINNNCVITANFTTDKPSTCIGGQLSFTNASSGLNGSETYSWNFGSGATPPTATGIGPHKVSYSTSGSKDVSLTVSRTGSSDTKTKTAAVTIDNPVVGCLFKDDYDDAKVSWVGFTGAKAPFTSTEANGEWTVSNVGHDEWDNFTYTLNNGTTATPLNFSCSGNKAILKIRAKASANCILRIEMMDTSSLGTDFVPSYDLELGTTYQTYTIDYTGYLYNKYSCTKPQGPCYLDSSIISRLRFFINPGYVSYPIQGKLKLYNTSFANQTVTIDWIGIGDNCSQIPAVADFTASKTTPCTGESITFTSASANTDANTKYLWDFGSGASPATANTAGPHTVTYSTGGLKTVKLTLDGGVSIKTKTDYLDICIPTGIETKSAEDFISLYPNPAKSEINFNIASKVEEDITIILSNSLSQEIIRSVKRVNQGHNSLQLPLNELENGLYFVTIRKGSESFVKRISIVK